MFLSTPKYSIEKDNSRAERGIYSTTNKEISKYSIRVAFSSYLLASRRAASSERCQESPGRTSGRGETPAGAEKGKRNKSLISTEFPFG